MKEFNPKDIKKGNKHFITETKRFYESFKPFKPLKPVI